MPSQSHQALTDLKPILIITGYTSISPSYNYETNAFQKNIAWGVLIIWILLIQCGFSIYDTSDESGFIFIINLSVTLLWTSSACLTVFASSNWSMNSFRNYFNLLDEIDAYFFSIHNLKVPSVKYVLAKFFSCNFVLLGFVVNDFYYDYVTSTSKDVNYLYPYTIERVGIFLEGALQFFMMEVVKARMVVLRNLLGYLAGKGGEDLEFIAGFSDEEKERKKPEQLDIHSNSFFKVLEVKQNWSGTEQTNESEKMVNCLLIHKRISDVLRWFNEIFKRRLFVMILYIFLGLLKNLYYILSDHQGKSATVNTLISEIPFLIQIVALTVNFEKILSEAEAIVTSTNELLIANLGNPKSSMELSVLFYQTTALKPNFSAGGFFDLNYPMLFMLVNLTATYIIIMIQLLH